MSETLQIECILADGVVCKVIKTQPTVASRRGPKTITVGTILDIEGDEQLRRGLQQGRSCVIVSFNLKAL